jgi:hypothetical protein
MRIFATRILADLVASAVALIVADIFLDRFTVTAGSLPLVVVLFTVFRLIIRLLMKATIVLASLAGLGAAFGSLVVTDIASSGLKIRGLVTWVLATLIVWLGGIIGDLVVEVRLRRQLRAAR